MVEKRKIEFGEEKNRNISTRVLRNYKKNQGSGITFQDTKDFFTDINFVGRAVEHRTLIGSGFKMKDYTDYSPLEEKAYEPSLDPQLQPYLDLVPTKFFDSRSREESTFRLKKMQQLAEDSKNPWFIGTSILSEMFLDPSSLLLISQPLRLAILGRGVNRFGKIGGIMVGEESFKQVADRNRTTADIIVTATFGVLLKSLSPMLSKYDKRYNKYRYDPSNDRGYIFDADDFFSSTKTEVGISGLLEDTQQYVNRVLKTKSNINVKPNPTIVPKVGVPKNVKEIMLNMKNQYPDLNIVLGSGVGKNIGNRYISAYYNNSTNTMTLDIDAIKKLYTNKSYTKSKVKDVIPFKVGDFKSSDEFVNFVMKHEFAHKTMRPREGENKAQYENRINQIAYDEILDDRKGIVKVGSTLLDDAKVIEQEKVNYIRYEKEVMNQLRLDELDYKKVVGSKLKFLSPLDYLINTNSRVVKEFGMNMLTNSLFYKYNFTKKYSTPHSAEQLRNIEHLPKLAETIEEGYRITNKINQRILGRKTKFYEASKVHMKYLSPMSTEEVFKEVFYARLNNNQHVVPEIAEYAGYIGKFFFDPFAEDIARLGLYFMAPIKREEFLSGIIQNMISKKIDKMYIKSTKETYTLQEARKLLKEVEVDLQLANFAKIPNYTPINYIFTQISLRWKTFKPLMMKLMTEARTPKGKVSFDPDDIEEIVDGFMNYEPNSFPKIPKGLPPGEVYKLKSGYFSKHLKQRYLKDIDYKQLAKAGFIEDNMEMNMAFYFRSVGPDIAIAKKYGDPYAFGWFYNEGKNGFAPGLQQIHEDYSKRIGAIGITKAKRLELIDEYNNVTIIAEATRELVKNKYGLNGAINGYVWKSTSLLKIFNNFTQLTGFSQIADIGRIITVDGLMNSSLQLVQAFTSGVGKEIFKKGLKEAKFAGQAWDQTIAWTRSNIISGNDFLNNSFTGAEKVFQEANSLMFQYGNMQNPWNVVLKTVATVTVQTKILNILEDIASQKKIAAWKRAYVADLGFGSGTEAELEMISRVVGLYHKHGNGKNTLDGVLNKNADLINFPNTELWLDDVNAMEAAMKFRLAINKEVDNVIVTPRLGDAPLIANTMIGSLIFQYKKFSLAYTRIVLQRGLQSGDGMFIQRLVSLTALGVMIDAVRSSQTDQVYANKTLREKLLDGAERGGIGGIFTDIDRIIMALSNNNIGIRPSLLGVKSKYGSSLKQKLGAISPTGSTIGNIAEILYDWGRGRQTNHTARRIRRTIPYNNMWYADSLFDKLEKGLY